MPVFGRDDVQAKSGRMRGAGTEVGPEVCTFSVNERVRHPDGECPVCRAAKLVYRETCSEICGELLWLVKRDEQRRYLANVSLD